MGEDAYSLGGRLLNETDNWLRMASLGILST